MLPSGNVGHQRTRARARVSDCAVLISLFASGGRRLLFSQSQCVTAEALQLFTVEACCLFVYTKSASLNKLIVSVNCAQGTMITCLITRPAAAEIHSAKAKSCCEHPNFPF